jgi:hypothetical protein
MTTNFQKFLMENVSSAMFDDKGDEAFDGMRYLLGGAEWQALDEETRQNAVAAARLYLPDFTP